MNNIYEIVGKVVIYSFGILGTCFLILLGWLVFLDIAWKEAKCKYNVNILDFINWLDKQKEEEKRHE